ncbi:leucyl aminopeptidase family protein, partial [Brevirhabdus pacifica]
AATGQPLAVLAGHGTPATRRRGRFATAGIAAGLPAGTYRLECDLDGPALEEAALGWLLSAYRFDRYKSMPPAEALLLAPDGVDAKRLEILAAAEFLTRDLVNTPASDLGPDALEAALRDLAEAHGAGVSVTAGDQLLTDNFPLIHTVGRAAAQAPRLLDMRWGSEGPTLTLVGKGVCFDTGGLNIKPGTSMGLMKKDMGGAANVMGLASAIMALKLPLRLRVLIPAVENAIDGSAFRPGDILPSRKGLTVEVNNTDAEGRLVLADALALACEEPPEMLISMATLTGAARVAVGPDLAPFYTDDDDLARELSEAGGRMADPVWRLPFWDPYEALIEPETADLDNAPSGGFAGSITAALFLRRFVGEGQRYCHFDIFAWRPTGKPGLPKGGLGQGPRALLHTIERVLLA